MIYYLVRKSCKDEKKAQFFLKAFLLTGIGVIAISFLQLLDVDTYFRLLSVIARYSQDPYDDPFFKLSAEWRLAGPFLNANSLGYFCLMFAGPILGLIGTKRKIGLSMLILVLILIILVKTLSRESYIGFALVILSWGWYKIHFQGLTTNHMKVGLIVAIILAGTIFVFWDTLYSRTVEYTFGTRRIEFSMMYPSEGLNVRWLIWGQSLQALKNYWLLGMGLTQAWMAIREVAGYSLGIWSLPHNTFLTAWLDGGIVGIATLLYLLYNIWRLHLARLSNYWGHVRDGFLAACAGLVGAGMFGEPFQNVFLLLPFMYFMGLISRVCLGKVATQSSLFSHSAKD
jgi:O-antigen ligase